MKLDPDEYDAIAGAFFETEGREPTFAEVEREFNDRFAYLVDRQKEVRRDQYPA